MLRLCLPINLAVGPVLLLASLLASCSEQAPTGPPQIRLGRDQCAECGMMISEDRCSAASLIRTDGAVSHLLWDDVGCLLDWESDEARRADSTELLERWVHDYESREWIAAGRATFLVGEGVLTPMASGIVAFADRGRAETAQARSGGVLVSFAGLAEIRAAQVRDRRGGSDDDRTSSADADKAQDGRSGTDASQGG